MGVYEDLGGPAIANWVDLAVLSPKEITNIIINDDKSKIISEISKFSENGFHLILTTGGTGPTKKDVTPEAMMEVCDKILDGFAQQMRTASLVTVPTAILSRQTAGVVGDALVINLPGKPEAIDVCLKSIFLAVPKCVELLSDRNIQIDLDFIES
jgi:molybdopterin adenylyltransferase